MITRLLGYQQITSLTTSTALTVPTGATCLAAFRAIRTASGSILNVSYYS